MSHGDHWSAIFDDVEADTYPLIERMSRSGKLVTQAQVELTDERGVRREEQVAALEYPATPLRYLEILATDSSNPEPGWDLCSAFPFCAAGFECPLEVVELLPDPDYPTLEGGLQLATTEGGLVWLTDPFFFANRPRYREGEVLPFRVAGLAYTLRKAEAEFVEVNEGNFLEFHRQKLREENPTVDVSGVTSVKLSMKGSHSLFPHEEEPLLASIYRAPVEAVSYFDVDGLEFVRCDVTLIPHEEAPLRAAIYAATARLGGYRPEVGDDIEGALWLQGYPSRWLADGAEGE